MISLYIKSDSLVANITTNFFLADNEIPYVVESD